MSTGFIDFISKFVFLFKFVRKTKKYRLIT